MSPASSPRKLRLDQLLVARNLAPTRTKAQALIRSGVVFCGSERLDKPGMMVPGDTSIECREKTLPFVSRGGLKLAHALQEFQVDVKGKIALDIGASTGGFTDCLLQNGVTQVIALDVGKNQLDYKLRQDSRVICIEGFNARYLKASDLPFVPEIVTCDVSFISLTLIFPALFESLPAGITVIALIKPQFEAGRGDVSKKGVVKDPQIHQQVLARITEWLASRNARLLGTCESPLLGPKGNKEFFIYFSTPG